MQGPSNPDAFGPEYDYAPAHRGLTVRDFLKMEEANFGIREELSSRALRTESVCEMTRTRGRAGFEPVRSTSYSCSIC